MDLQSLSTFFSGALMMTFAVAGLFFLRFWQRTRDGFFRTFALSFWLLAIERIVLVAINAPHEEKTYIYFIRLVAFLLIIFAIMAKNRAKPALE